LSQTQKNKWIPPKSNIFRLLDILEHPQILEVPIRARVFIMKVILINKSKIKITQLFKLLKILSVRLILIRLEVKLNGFLKIIQGIDHLCKEVIIQDNR